MGECCNSDFSIDKLRERQSGTLKIVLGVNTLMFLIIMAAAVYGRSSALLSDSLDNLGDALTYGMSLYVVARSNTAKARVALFKGWSDLPGVMCCHSANFFQTDHSNAADFRDYGCVQHFGSCRERSLPLSALASSQ